MKIKMNTSNIPNEYILDVARAVAPPGVTGVSIKVSQKRGGGRAWPRQNRVFIAVGGNQRFTRNAVPGKGYLRMVVAGRFEWFLIVMAHELRHIWQRLHKNGRTWGCRGQYSEKDADVYALRILRAFRRGERPELTALAAIFPKAPAPVVKDWSAIPAMIKKVLDKHPGVKWQGGDLLAPNGYLWEANSLPYLTGTVREIAADAKDGLREMDAEELQEFEGEEEAA